MRKLFEIFFELVILFLVVLEAIIILAISLIPIGEISAAICVLLINSIESTCLTAKFKFFLTFFQIEHSSSNRPTCFTHVTI